jgi:AAA+ superfamily predicted ATPase
LTQPIPQQFLGRKPEMSVLTGALDDALADRGQMVMLAGEPGIGKTRLAQELAAHAESLGAQVMWGWCYEHVGAAVRPTHQGLHRDRRRPTIKLSDGLRSSGNRRDCS